MPLPAKGEPGAVGRACRRRIAGNTVLAESGSIWNGSNGYNVFMRRIAAREAKNGFGRLLDASQTAPVLVTKKDRPVSVLMSVQQYERLRGAAWERLTQTMDALGREATANGLTESELNALLADES